MANNNDCPICYEQIPHNINCSTTECGHTFHTTCLMKHTIYNGYDCPCCRTLMAAAPPKGTTTTIRYNDENSSDSETSVDERMNSYDDGVMQYTTYHNSITSEEHEYEDDDETRLSSPPIYDDYVLDGCRWMFQRATANSTTTTAIVAEDAEDPYIDAFESWQIQINENCREFQTEVDRKADTILDVLKKIKALSHDDLVKGYLFCIDEYFGGSTEFAQYDQKVTSTLKSVMNRFVFVSSSSTTPP